MTDTFTIAHRHFYAVKCHCFFRVSSASLGPQDVPVSANCLANVANTAGTVIWSSFASAVETL